MDGPPRYKQLPLIPKVVELHATANTSSGAPELVSSVQTALRLLGRVMPQETQIDTMVAGMATKLREQQGHFQVRVVRHREAVAQGP